MIYITDLHVSAMICRLDFLCFFSVHPHVFSTLPGKFFYGNTIGLTNKATASSI